MHQLENPFLELVLDAEANWTPASLIDKENERRSAGPIRVGYYLANEDYVDEREIGGPGDVTEARVERCEEDGSAVLTARLQTRHFDILRRFALRPDEPFLHCSYEITPRPGIRERGGRLDMPLVTFGDGIESPMTTGNDVFQFPVDLGGGLLRSAWRLARDSSGAFGLGLLLPQPDLFRRADVTENGFAMRSRLFRCFWKDSDSMWRINWSDDPAENTTGTGRFEFCLFPYRGPDWQPDALELFAGSTYGPGRAVWVGPVIPVQHLPEAWPPRLAHERRIELCVPVGGEVRLLVLSRDGCEPRAVSFAGDDRARAAFGEETAGGRVVSVRVPGGEPEDRIEGELDIASGSRRVTVPLRVSIVEGALAPDIADGVVVPARDIASSVDCSTRYVPGEWWWREDVPSLGGAGALFVEGWECTKPLVVDSPVSGHHAVVAGVGAADGALAHVPATGPLRGVASAGERLAAASQTTRAPGTPQPVFGNPFRLRQNEVHLGTADLTGKAIALAPLHRFPEIMTLQYVRFVPAGDEPRRPTAASRRRLGLGGICDVFDIAHTYGVDLICESTRGSRTAQRGFPVTREHLWIE